MMEPIVDPKTDYVWGVLPHEEVEGAVDLYCEVVVSFSGKKHRFKLECVPIPILEQLLEQAKALTQEERG